MWIALYNDGEQLNQFNEDGSENLFKEIDQSKLDRFIVRNQLHEVILNLKTGDVKINGLKMSFGYEDHDHRLIYFRRVRQTFGLDPLSCEYVGWQSTIPGSNGPFNIKRIIGLTEDKVTIQCD